MVTQSDANNVSDIEDTNKDKVECIYLSQTIKKDRGNSSQLLSTLRHFQRGKVEDAIMYAMLFIF